ncbi:arsenate reductase [Chitinivorax tropicus]|uniref:Arsenate reductase n=1 Tax=Chitinivorax tropicus TaxID=714531 RepID=A0A840MU04_9PROT|nr:arsenate reductase (glutaredoxin) [Chitinivorax tropicus]MBB5018671.1 arsenate reductase [Chitinivorax tropicus]
MMKARIYHNPRCSKSRQAIDILTQAGCQIETIEYLVTPPSIEELDNLLTLLGLPPQELMRQDEAPYQALGLGDASLSRETLITAMAANPILIQRPIVVIGNQAIIARPPERLATWLTSIDATAGES